MFEICLTDNKAQKKLHEVLTDAMVGMHKASI
jgi:hypothetical protein